MVTEQWELSFDQFLIVQASSAPSVFIARSLEVIRVLPVVYE